MHRLEKNLQETHNSFNKEFGDRDLNIYLNLIHENFEEANKHYKEYEDIKSMRELVDIISLCYDAIQENHDNPSVLIENRLQNNKNRCENGEFNA